MKQIYDGDWVVIPRRLICCDCGLVHKIYFRIYNGELQMKVFRDNRGSKKIRKSLPFIFQRKVR